MKNINKQQTIDDQSSSNDVSDNENLQMQEFNIDEDLSEDEEEIQQSKKPQGPRTYNNQIPDSLKNIFSNKAGSIEEKVKEASIFNKTRGLDTKTDSSNIQNDAMLKAEALYKKLNVFNKIPVNAKQITPLNNIQLEKKERLKQREASAGKSWGHMAKQELTEEVKADLRAIQLRNFIFPNRFYKSTDLKKLPKYFQIGTVIPDKNEPQNMRLTKKEQKGSIAQQFMREDNEKMFSKKKYEKVNDRLRRMGEKKRKMKMNKIRHKANNRFKSKEAGKPKK